MATRIFYPIQFLFSLAVTVSGCKTGGGSESQITEAQMQSGKALYQIHCSACHQDQGQGFPGVHPPLNQTHWVLGSKERLINIVLNGLQDRITVHGKIYEEVMPGIPQLSDHEVADVLTYIRNSFGNEASSVTETEVKMVREGQSLEENIIDFTAVSPEGDHKKSKVKDGVESRIGTFYKQGEINLETIFLPENFHIEIFAEGLENPRSMTLGPKGTVFVGSRRNKEDFIYALQDHDQNGKADTIIRITKGLKWNPMGVAMRGNDLYVGEIDRILKFENIEDQIFDPPDPKLIFSYPPEKKHGDKYIRFGPDDMLYVPVGAPCNNCLDENPIFASITRINSEGKKFEIFAHGVRNSRGFDWHPETGELWFTDNGRDHMGDDMPPCEVNRAPEPGMHFGYPYCHGGAIRDPEYGDLKSCDEFTPQTFGLVAHAAPVSMLFYTGTMFPEKYKNQILISEHGSWNRAEKQGYRIMLLELEGNDVVKYEPFAYGWLNEDENDAWGRPADILQMPDGSILLSDDYAGVIYRIFYKENR